MISRQLEIENAFSRASYFLPKIRFVYTVYLIFFLDIKESFIEIIAFKRFQNHDKRSYVGIAANKTATIYSGI